MQVPAFVALDLETTGLDPAQDQIIEVGAVRFENGRETASYQCLVDPGRPIPLRVQRLTGISPGMMAGARPVQAALAALVDFCRGVDVVAYNLEFDLAFLQDKLRRAGLAPSWSGVRDCLELARLAVPALGDYRLGAVAAHLGVAPASHRAVEDARACGLSFVELSRRLENLPAWALDEVLAIMQVHSWPLRQLLEEALARSRTRPGTFQPGVPVAPPAPPETVEDPVYQPVDPAQLCALLHPGSRLAQAFAGYEYRPQQVQMLHLVTEALNDGRMALVEAGTGTGKSMAYLLPAVSWAMANAAPVVVSTHTITLQEQLVEKDIPLLRRALDLDFQVALVKGRRNYVCLHKWEHLRRSSPVLLDVEEARWQSRVVAWLGVTRTGDKAELNLPPRGEELWPLVAADSDYCRGNECPHRDRCFVQAARRSAAQAQLIVVNHSLLISDLRTENLILPRYHHVVLDEAHHLEDVATEHLSEEASAQAFLRLLDALGTTTEGALGLARYHLRSEGAGTGVEAIAGALAGRLADIRTRAGSLFAQFGTMLDQGQTGADDGYAQPRRLRPASDTSQAWQLCRERAARLQDAVMGVGPELEELRQCGQAGGRRSENALADLERLIQSLRKLAHPVSLLLEADEEASVYWLEPGSGGAILRVAPVHVGPLLYQRLFSALRGAVLTSATLTVEGKFDYFCERVGLDRLAADRLVWESIGSPFCYHRQALVAVPVDHPPPRGKDTEDFARAVESFLRRLLPLAGGRTLVLFTSHRLLRQVYYQLRQPMEAEDICILAQGIDGSRTRLLEEFRTAQRTALFGSSSFWEGVDVPGEALSCVVLVKLPFTPPTSPVFAARTEELERRGLPAFRRLALPQAVLRFKQGFGRLIRSGQDRGVVIVLDQRVLGNNSRYGHLFIGSLPGPRLLAAPGDEVLEAVGHWLEAGVLMG
ncbi:MAG: helicase C-terminal domain-containing protein [Bacillota bacterium]